MSTLAPVTTCGSCTRASENSSSSCPPRMSDGRLFTSYDNRCTRNLKYAQAGVGSQDLRLFLINNGIKIMEQDRAAAAKVAFCAPCKTPWQVATMAPETDRFVCDKVSCTRVAVPQVPGGQPGLSIGTGREYGSFGGDQEGQTFIQSQVAAQAAYARPNQGNCCDPSPAGAYGQAYPGATLTPPGPSRWAVPGGGAPLGGGDPSVSLFSQ